ncbi:SPRY domain-containing protein [Ditylenchus destructor]|nr:SPRY domain-containing protein [Ditylenchus destructor]
MDSGPSASTTSETPVTNPNQKRLHTLQDLYPMYNEECPLPSRLAKRENEAYGLSYPHKDVQIGCDGLSVSFNKAEFLVRTDHPIQRDYRFYYFEARVERCDQNSKEKSVVIGLAHEWSDDKSFPGMQPDSYGLDHFGNVMHDGNKIITAFPFKAGQIVGCGVDFEREEIFFTNDGLIATVKVNLPVDCPIYPALGISREGAWKANFGQEAFAFNIKDHFKTLRNNPKPADMEIGKAIRESNSKPQLKDSQMECRPQQLYPRLVDEELPNMWDFKKSRYGLLTVSEDGFNVTYKQGPSGLPRPATILADRPIPPNKKSFFHYFEVTILNKGLTGNIHVGHAAYCQNMAEMLGCSCTSLGYNARTGHTHGNCPVGSPYGPALNNGDIIGCAWDCRRRMVFYTLNGERIKCDEYDYDVPFVNVKNYGSSYPAISLMEQGAEIHANFGQEPFAWKDVFEYAKTTHQRTAQSEQVFDPPKESISQLPMKSVKRPHQPSRLFNKSNGAHKRRKSLSKSTLKTKPIETCFITKIKQEVVSDKENASAKKRPLPDIGTTESETGTKKENSDPPATAQKRAKLTIDYGLPDLKSNMPLVSTPEKKPSCPSIRIDKETDTVIDRERVYKYRDLIPTKPPTIFERGTAALKLQPTKSCLRKPAQPQSLPTTEEQGNGGAGRERQERPSGHIGSNEQCTRRAELPALYMHPRNPAREQTENSFSKSAGGSVPSPTESTDDMESSIRAIFSSERSKSERYASNLDKFLSEIREAHANSDITQRMSSGPNNYCERSGTTKFDISVPKAPTMAPPEMQPCSSKSIEEPSMIQPPDLFADDHNAEAAKIEAAVCRRRQQELYGWINFEQEPLPTKWWRPTPSVELTDNGLTATFDRPVKGMLTKGGAQTNYNIPPTCKIYYFEVYIEELGKNSFFSIGFGEEWSQNSAPVGLEWITYGLCSDGQFCSNAVDGPILFKQGFKQGFEQGDTIGCGLDFVNKTIFYTKNGKNKMKAGEITVLHQIRVHAKIGFSSTTTGSCVKVKGNFGQQAFLYPIEEELEHIANSGHKPIERFECQTFPVHTNEQLEMRSDQLAKFTFGTKIKAEDLPLCWNANDRRYNLGISGTGHLVASFLGPVNPTVKGVIETACAAAVRSDKPIPPNLPFYYFEVTILHGGGENGRIAVGVGLKEASLGVSLGSEYASMCYRSDSRACLNRLNGTKWAKPFETRDVVGCGINRAPKKKDDRTEIFFTKNGAYMGYGWYGLSNDFFYPMVSMLVKKKDNEDGERVKVNFGQERFLFDVDKYMKDEVDRNNLKVQIKDEPAPEVCEEQRPSTSCALPSTPSSLPSTIEEGNLKNAEKPRGILKQGHRPARRSKSVTFNLAKEEVEEQDDSENSNTNTPHAETTHEDEMELPATSDFQRPSFTMNGRNRELAEPSEMTPRKIPRFDAPTPQEDQKQPSPPNSPDSARVPDM